MGREDGICTVTKAPQTFPQVLTLILKVPSVQPHIRDGDTNVPKPTASFRSMTMTATEA